MHQSIGDDIRPEEKPKSVLGLLAFGPQGGFTLIELIVGLVVIGILAAVALPRWQGETGFEARQFRDETVAALRFAQKAAIATRRTVCAAFTSTQVSFRVSDVNGVVNCIAGTPLSGPDGRPLVVNASSGTSYASPAAPFGIVFDASGSPIGGGTSITVSGLAGMPVAVEAGTGYVH